MTLEAFITPSRADARHGRGESDLAALFPADTQLYVETRELGSHARRAPSAGSLATMDEQTAAEMAPLEDMFGVPLPELLDFVSDAGVGAAITSDGLWLGIAAEVTDEAVAQDRVRAHPLHRAALAVPAWAARTPRDQRRRDRSSATRTSPTITLPIDESTGGELPFDDPQHAQRGHRRRRRCSSGSGDFVENALTQAEAATRWRPAPGYVDALGEDTTNSGLIYANVGSLLRMLDPLLAMMAPEWADIAPYATALDRFIAVGTADEDVISARMSRHRRAIVEPGCTIRRAPHCGARRCRRPALMPASPSARPTGGLQSPLAVRIRLTRVGATKQPSYRFVVADSRSARDGRSLDTLGHYNPRSEPIEINVDAEKATQWLAKGAKPTDTVERLFRRVGILPDLG